MVLWRRNLVLETKSPVFMLGEDGKLIMKNGVPVTRESYFNETLLKQISIDYGMNFPEDTQVFTTVYPKDKYDLPYIEINMDLISKLERFGYEYQQELTPPAEEDREAVEPDDFTQDSTPDLSLEKQPTTTEEIKPGVEELFESNPELANQVYEALGYEPYYNWEKELIHFHKEVEHSFKPGLTKLPNGNYLVRAFRTDDSGFGSKGFGQRGKGLYLSITDAYPGKNVSTVEFEISPSEILTYKQDKYPGTIPYEKLEKAREGTFEEAVQNVGGKAFIGGINGAEDKYLEIVLYDKELINKAISSKKPYSDFFSSNKAYSILKKQQALQLYSQYLDTIFPNSKVKDIVYHGAYEKFDKFDKLKRGLNTGLGTYIDKITGESIDVDSANAFFFTNNKIAATSYAFKGREALIKKVESALQSVSVSIGRSMDPQEAVNYLKKIPYYNNLIEVAKKEGKSKEEIIDILKKEWNKVRDVSKSKSAQSFSNWKNNNKEDIQDAKTLLLNLDKLKNNDPSIQVRFGDFNQTTVGRDSFYIFFENGEYTFISKEDRFTSTQASTEKIKSFLNDYLNFLLVNEEQRKTEQKQSGYVENIISAVISLKNPLIHDYKNSAFPDVYNPNPKYETSYIAARQVKSALKENKDGVIYENIKDPFSLTSYGVFEPEQIHILGNKQDIEGFKNFIQGESGETTTEPEVTPPTTPGQPVQLTLDFSEQKREEYFKDFYSNNKNIDEDTARVFFDNCML
jgi:hypothetical protein